MLETDVLVVGGGPAGATTAKYLSESSVDAILVQRNFSFKKPCGGGIRIDAFDEFEIDKTFITKSIETVALVHKELRVEVDISKTPIAIVDRVAFDMHLREQAQSAGVRLYEAIFINLEIYDDYIISTIKKDDKYIKIKSNYLVAADGVNSKIRKLVNGDEVSASLTNYTDLLSKTYDICEFHFGKEVAGNCYSWAFPHASGSNIGTVVANGGKTIAALLQTLNIQEKSKILGYKIPHFKDTIFYKRRVFFVGDSASQVLPFTYEGIYYAMSSAKILADVISNKEAPQMYEKNWNQKYYKKFNTLLKLQNLFLQSNFMIRIMMAMYENRYIQEQMVEFWLGKREFDLSWKFFSNVAMMNMKRLLKPFNHLH